MFITCKGENEYMRSLWKGAITFGMLNIPVAAYKAIDDHDVKFNQISEKDGGRIRYKKVSEKDGHEVLPNEIIKAFEVSEGRYIPVLDTELEAIKIKSAKAIDITQFGDATELDDAAVEGCYYIAPEEKKPVKAFQLLALVMRQENLVAVGKMVMREREHLVALKPYEDGFLLQLLAYPDEVRKIKNIKTIENLPTPKFVDTEVQLATQLVNSMKPKKLDLSSFKDEFTEQVQALITAKASGTTYTAPSVALPSETADLASALTLSLKAVSKAE